jgi:hypothetical protein
MVDRHFYEITIYRGESMCTNPTQPEEIEPVIREMERSSLIMDELTDKKPQSQATQIGKHTHNLSAYRAEYIKAHKLDTK